MPLPIPTAVTTIRVYIYIYIYVNKMRIIYYIQYRIVVVVFVAYNIHESIS